MVDDELWVCERRFWLDSTNFYRECVVQDALLVLPAPHGILDRRAGMEAVRTAPRWLDVTFSRQQSLRATNDTAVLAYAARADNGNPEQLYYAYCSSTYVRARRSWMLVAHQQGAITDPDQELTGRGALKLFFAGSSPKSDAHD